ncbi:bifunctional folylpolyglutamate synthase/dihydrofolate synthase [Natroniella sulfidigena]|uniref:bifunctional folylpolyglutamate synthase/dihydrofolate synthase n=1 Tax=Natroniella sulfidigena TaxID=723921 RepID=UPI00200A6A6C|nr:folylpolyglutamate synthase/dihydrofolate synthase family protein [Natroniella sulfidigena]MCK8815851.1 bifunctional folylpolyglutamate synthase/dihydrofolate synthase [Natroniella sulfidigena]
MKEMDYLESLDKYDIKPGLERIELLLEYLGNPQDKLNVIHIAGTNGKGSTSAILTSIYKEAGYKVGTYNSPEIVEFNERMRINGVNISDRDLKEGIQKIKPLVSKVEQELERPSFFEVVTALAIDYFAQQELDLTILEVGLGGRLDATNVVGSLVSVITNVSLDHTEFLGDTIEEIAFEKGGIIKEGQQVITATDDQEVLAVLQKICAEKDAKLVNVLQEYEWQSKEGTLAYQNFDLQGPTRDYLDLRLSLLGEHQIINTATAMGVIEALAEEYPVAIEAIRAGVSDVKWPGRLEVVNSEPVIILDGAHNQAGASRLKSAIEDLEFKDLTLVLSILGDKDLGAMIEQIAPLANKVILTKNKNKRVAEINILKEEVVKYNSNVEMKEDLVEVLDDITAQATAEDIILISGSLYTVAEARKIILDYTK